MCVMFNSRSSVSVLTGAEGPRVASHALKSRFMPYFKTMEQSASLPFALFSPEHWPQSGEIMIRVLGHDAGDVGGIDDHGALLFEDRDRFGHRRGLVRD